MIPKNKDPRTEYEKEVEATGNEDLPSNDPYDNWEDDCGSQNETLDGMD
jgi:hypothetical protein